MPGQIGEARSCDINPNGPIVPLPNLILPGTLTLGNYATYGNPTVLNIIGSGTWSISSLAGAPPTTGAYKAANADMYVPVNGQNALIFNGSGSLGLTLYTNRYSES